MEHRVKSCPGMHHARPSLNGRLLVHYRLDHAAKKDFDVIMLTHDVPALILAPMDGVTDAAMRAVQGETGAFTFTVSEFLRVSQEVPPKRVFHRHLPELCKG